MRCACLGFWWCRTKKSWRSDGGQNEPWEFVGLIVPLWCWGLRVLPRKQTFVSANVDSQHKSTACNLDKHTITAWGSFHILLT